MYRDCPIMDTAVASFLLICISAYIGVASGMCPMTSQNSVEPNPRYCFYPSLNNSSDFDYCCGTEALSYSCPQGLIFNPRISKNDLRPLCVSKRQRRGGFSFSCRRASGNGSYSGDPSLYVTCVNRVPTTLHECPKGHQLEKWTQRCAIVCSGEGNFASSDKDYYTCTFEYSFLRYRLKTASCPPDTTFVEGYQFCLPATPTDSSSTTPADSGSTTPAVSSSTTPADSSSTTPADSSNTTPAGNGSTTPTGNGSTTPADSSSTTPADISSTTPADISSTTPADISSTTPADSSSVTTLNP